MAITEEALQPLLDDISNLKHTVRSAAAELGISDFRFRSAVKRLGLKLPPRKRVAALLAERYSRAELLDKSSHELAKELNVTQPSVHNALKALGLQENRRSSQADKRIDNCEAVLDYIRENGGYVKAARDALGLTIDLQAVRNYAKTAGFNLDKYRIAYQQFGYWIIQPCVPEPCYTADFRVKALCTRCGTMHDGVLLTNLRGGNSKGCHLCYGKPEVSPTVKCLETGKVFKSIRSFCIAIAKPKKYQTIRIKLHKAGAVTVDGYTYVIVN